MDTIIYKTIDGIEIVAGFGSLLIDPISTEAKAKKIIESTDEYLNFKALKEQINQNIKKAQELQKESRILAFNGNQAEAEKKWIDSRTEIEKNLEVQKNIKIIVDNLIEKRKQIFNNEPIFFEPKKGEESKSTEEIEKIKTSLNSLSTNQLLKKDGDVITDYRGKKYFVKESDIWKERFIAKLETSPGVNWIEMKDLNDAQKKEIADQKELLRLSLLSGTDKLSEFEQKKMIIASQASNYKAQLEFDEEPDAAIKAKAWYDEKLIELKKIYGYA